MGSERGRHIDWRELLDSESFVAATRRCLFAPQSKNSYFAPRSGNALAHVPKIGNIEATCMMLIGAAALADYAAKCPQASPALRALNALIRQATWTRNEDLARSCGAVMRLDEGGMALLALREAGCEVALKINYDLGVVRVIAVRDLQGDQDA